MRKKTDPKRKTQQISDNLAQRVAKGLISHSDAIKTQRKKDSLKMATVKQTGKQNHGAPLSSVKWKAAQFRRDNKGNITSY